MNAQMDVESEGDQVTIKRYMPNSTPPPTYVAAYPFKGQIDRWQEIEFCPSHIKIWTGGIDAKSGSVTDIEEVKQKFVEQTRLTFDEDKVVIEAQFKTMKRFKGQPMIDIHVDAGANHARRIISTLCE